MLALPSQQILNFSFFQMSTQGPLTGNFGHFFVYAPADAVDARDYGVARYGMEVLRISDVLEKQLARQKAKGSEWLVGDSYSLADIMLFPCECGVERSGAGVLQDHSN